MAIDAACRREGRNALGALDRIVWKLDEGELVFLDGATGTELTRRGADTTPPLWSARALIDAPATVRDVHADYIRAGAEVLVANTFRTASLTLNRAGFGNLADELPDRAVALLLEAIEREDAADRVVPAGCLSPLADRIHPELAPPEAELAAEHEAHAVRQALAGAELIACETMSLVREAVVALRAAKAAGLPAFVSFAAADTRHLLSGETLDTAVRAVEPLEPLAIGLNCCSMEVIDGALPILLALTKRPVCVYPHFGVPNESDGWTADSEVSPERFAERAEGWRNIGARMIGGCCGSTPAHIVALRNRLLGSGGEEKGA